MNCYIINKIDGALGSGLEMTHFFNNKQVLMENVSFQDLTLFCTFFSEVQKELAGVKVELGKIG